VKNAFKIALECGVLTVKASPLAGASAGNPYCTKLKGLMMLKTGKNLVYGMAGNIQRLSRDYMNYIKTENCLIDFYFFLI
jgi:hypothetical protein